MENMDEKLKDMEEDLNSNLQSLLKEKEHLKGDVFNFRKSN